MSSRELPGFQHPFLRATLPLAALLSGFFTHAPTLLADSAQVTLPPYPYWPNPSIQIDATLLEETATDYCADTLEASNEDFFFRHLPLWSVDALCSDDNNEVSTLLGNLYLSGYFGGLWLRDALEETSNRLAAWNWSTPPADQFLPTPTALAPEGARAERVVFKTLARIAQAQTRTALEGSPASVLLSNRTSLPGLLSLYGYNLGYTLFMLSAPPDGAELPPDLLVCGDYVLECYSPWTELALLDRFWPVIDRLQHPSNRRWVQMNALVETHAEGSMAAGEEVWEDIMTDSTLSPEAYTMLMELSVGFLLVSDATALADIAAWADRDVDAGRCALLAEAGLTVWSASYFMGLISSAPPGTEPQVTCPGSSAQAEGG